ncbi:chorismate lyase [Halomonas sp. HP20-15]|uniref:chorismate--pyruvate lyase family protein n=1 Tax=Halomonas sp. HP20-15 TaxID=3085901 RepID=UPI0029813208|nr:chorismate lyase [Halomonas sp. HP20-15]MDW5375868.1 chorismate lyase [Halomonas sp. HP20-15]
MHEALPSHAASTRWPHWRPAAAWRTAMSPAWWRWLASRDSLTRRLVEAGAGDFRVRLLAQHVARVRPDEALALGIAPSQRVWCREVALCVGGRPWVVARSVATLASLRGQRLGQLGERSLGSWLFRQPGLVRGPIEIIRQPPPLHGEAGPWGRRSLLRHGRFAVLVQEFFLTRMADELELPLD